jgi:hypothetical protein
MTTVKKSRFNDWESATGSSAAVERKPWRPSARSPIGSNLPNLSNLATVTATRPDTDGPAKKLLKGLADLGKDADTKPEVTRPSADP